MTNDSLAALIQTHIEHYPELDIADVYKLLHQANFGSGTTDVNKKIEREWLESEYRTHKPDAKMQLIESASPEGKWVRLHLRPYMAAGGKIEPLLETFMVSAKQVQNNFSQMDVYWQAFESLAESRWSTHFAIHEVRLFGKIQASRKWPAVAHSPKFVRAYRPLYRVLVVDLAQKLCEKQEIAV